MTATLINAFYEKKPGYTFVPHPLWNTLLLFNQLAFWFNYVAAGKGYKSCSITSESRISQRLSWKASQGGMPWPACIVPCHIAGMVHYLTGRENSFLKSLDWQDFRMKDFIYIAFAVCPEFHVILCKINESLHYSIIQSSGWTSFI